ncbi:MAG: hypothetical protein Q9216_002435 [Gyalolechia sp. 2 TL-2023]
MPNQPLGGILQKLSINCTFPEADDLEDTTCHICLYDSLTPRGAEIPIRLRCGHVFGMACVINWASDPTRMGTDHPSCPMCRAPCFLHLPTQAALQAIEANDGTPGYEADDTTSEQRRQWFMSLYTSRPGRPTFLPSEEWWITRAEHLWVHFRNAIYDQIDLPVDPSEGIDNILLGFLNRDLKVAQFILSYGTVYNFFVAFRDRWTDLELQDKLNEVRDMVQEQYNQLTAHFETYDAVIDDDDHRWRISQGCGVEFVARMERKQARIRAHLDRVSPAWRSHIH